MGYHIKTMAVVCQTLEFEDFILTGEPCHMIWLPEGLKYCEDEDAEVSEYCAEFGSSPSSVYIHYVQTTYPLGKDVHDIKMKQKQQKEAE